MGQGLSCGEVFYGFGEAWGFPWCDRIVRLVGGRFVGWGLFCVMFDWKKGIGEVKVIGCV